MKNTLVILSLLMASLSVWAASPSVGGRDGGIRIQSGSYRETNITSDVTISGRTNVLAGSLTISNVTASSLVKVDSNKKTTAAVLGTDYVATRNILSTSHPDASGAASVVQGDLLYGNSTPKWGRLPVGARGSVLTPWVNTNNTFDLAWKKQPQIWEYTTVAIGDWVSIAANGGANGTTPFDTGDNGQFSQTTGVNTNGVAGYRSLTSAMYFVTNSQAVLWRVESLALSTDTDAFELIVGMGDATGDAEPVDGAYFYYTHSVSNGVWCAKTSNNSSRTFASGASSTPPAVAATTWYDLLLEGTSSVVNFWVSSDNQATWQFIGASSANIPSSTTRSTGMEAYIRKVGGSSGTAQKFFYIGRTEYWPP